MLDPKEFKNLVYEPVHEEGQTCWCNPKTTVEPANKKTYIDHNEQRDVLGREYEKLYDLFGISSLPHENKETYVKNIMNLTLKYFGDSAKICPDCGGPMWYMCEKNVRDIVLLVIKATESYYKVTKPL